MRRVRILAAGVLLLAAGGMLLSGGFRSRHSTAATANVANPNAGLQSFPVEAQFPNGANFSGAGKRVAPSQAQAILAGLPMIFEPNQGQANLDPNDPRARFVARGSGYSLILGSEGATLSLRSRDLAGDSRGKSSGEMQTIESLQMKLAGGNPHAELSAADPLPGKTNYFIGNDPSKWRSHVPQFARVRYENVYPGINLVFYGNQGRLEYDFQVAPGADPACAELEFNGARRLSVKNGALVVEGKNGSVRFDAPHVYQEIAGRQQPVEGSFVLRGAHRAGFAIGRYDRSRELVIDPVLIYSTYFGGSGDELATSVAVQGGFIYLSGSTDSPNLPVTANAPYTSLNTATSTNVYIAEINPTAGTNGLIYLTYLGGNGVDTPVGIGVDGAGQAYVAGTTSSTNFPPSADAYQSRIYAQSTGTQHVFASVVNPTIPGLAGLIYSSYLSGSGNDVATGMTIDSAGHIFVTGTTTSANTGAAGNASIQFPASQPPNLPALQSTFQSSIQFFVTEVSTNLGTGYQTVPYSTYFGGATAISGTTVMAQGGGIAVDTNDNIYFTGTTNFIYQGGVVGDFPILNAYQPCLDQTPPAIVINPPKCTYTSSNDGNTDAFAAKINPNPTVGGQLQFSTYLGGSGNDSGTGLVLDTAGNVYVTGTTNSTDFSAATSFTPYQPCLNNLYDSSGCDPTLQASPPANDAFVAKLTNPATGQTTTNLSLTYFSYLGGSNNEAGLAIAVDSAEGALLTGWTQSPASNPVQSPPPSGTFPVSSCEEIQCELAGTQNAFIARINTETNQNGTGNSLASWASFFGGSQTDQGTSVVLDVNQNTYFAGTTDSPNLHVAGPYQQCLDNLFTGTPPSITCTATPPAAYDAFVTQLGTAASISITGVLQSGSSQQIIPAGSQVTFIYTVTNSGPDLASFINVTDFLQNNGNTGTGVTMVPYSINSTAGPGTCTSVNSNATSIGCQIPTLQAGGSVTITIVLIPQGNSQNLSESFNGGTVIVSAPDGTQLAQTEVTGTMSDYSLSVSPGNITVQAAGDSAVYQVQLAPSGVYTANISLSCSLPATGTSCTFTNPTVTLSGAGAAATTMNVTTTARPVTPPEASLWTRHFYAIWLSLPGLALLGVGVGSNGRKRRVAGVLLLCVIGLILFLPACHSTTTQIPVTGTPTGTYTATVTATSGSDTKNYFVTLSVP